MMELAVTTYERMLLYKRCIKKTRCTTPATYPVSKVKDASRTEQIVNRVLDVIQTGLDVVGLIPGFGEIADAANAAIYTARGDYANAALSAAACIPIVGALGTTAKLVNKGSQVVETVVDGAKVIDNLADTSKIVDKVSDAGKAVDNISDVSKGIDATKQTSNVASEVIEGSLKSDLDGITIINKKYAGQTYELSGDLASKYPDGVKFTNEGFPDFSPYSNKTVKVDGLQGDAYYDFIKANQAAGFKSTPKGYTWHHVEDGNTLMLVPSDLHGTVRHTGGASLIREGIRP